MHTLANVGAIRTFCRVRGISTSTAVVDGFISQRVLICMPDKRLTHTIGEILDFVSVVRFSTTFSLVRSFFLAATSGCEKHNVVYVNGNLSCSFYY